MQLFIVTDLFPRGETGRERPSFHSEAEVMEDGDVEIIHIPESRGKSSWIIKWCGRGSKCHGDRWGRDLQDDWWRREIPSWGE